MGRRRSPPRGTTRPTLADVAARAGVSPATVSRALTRGDAVRSDTRRRVLAAAQALEYRPNRAARGLSTGSSGALGMLVPDITNPFFAGLIRAAQAGARSRENVLLIAETARKEEEERELLESLVGQVDGLIVCSPGPGLEQLGRRFDEVPMVFVNRRTDGVPAVVIDQEAIVRRAAGHLQELGHRHLAYVAGPEGLWSSQRRLEVVRALNAGGGVGIDVVGPFEPTFEGGAHAAEAVLASGATGVLVFNDVMALGLMTRLSALGVVVPDALSVVGSDDIPLAAMWTPALTTLFAPAHAAGEGAVALLHRLIEGGGDATDDREPTARSVQRLEFEGHLVVRASTARVRS